MFFSKLHRGGTNALWIDAKFMKPSTPLSVTHLMHLFDRYEVLPMDGCARLDRGLIVEGTGDVNTLDAGLLRLVGPAGADIPINKRSIFGQTIYEAQLPTETFQPLQQYELIHEWWSGSFWTPGDLTLTQPSPAAGAVELSGAQALALRWSSTPDGFPAYATLTKDDKTVTCRMQDDGSFDVPSSALSELDGFSTGPGSSDYGELRVFKYTWYFIGIDDNAAAMTVISEAGAELDLYLP